METRAPTHPTVDKLRGFALGQLDDVNAVAVMSHLDSCTQCQKEVAAVTGDYFLDRLREARNRSGTPLPGKSLSELTRSLYATVPPSASPSSISGLPPELLDHPQYEVVSELGRGGMGVVYLARHRLSGRLEVLKVMNKELLARSGSKERFLREIQSAAMLDHPNVVKMHTAMEMGDLMVLVMEYVKGEDLAKLVKAKGPLPVPNACFYAHQVALGLQHAFEKNMVHRDIKPQNVILAKEGKKHLVKVLDFGLAKVVRERGDQLELTGQGQMLGTPDYIAPEQTLDASNADIRADIYSLGCSLYFLLSGHAPFNGKSLFEILQAHQSREAPPLTLERPEVPPELATLVTKMMAKDPALRYQQPIEAAQALAPFFRTNSKVQPPKPSQDPPLEKAGPTAQEAKETKTGKTFAPIAEVVTEVKDAPASIPRPSSSHWELLRESDVASNEPLTGKKGVIRAVKVYSARNKKALVAAGALAGIVIAVLISLWAAGMFKVKTREGVLTVEVNEPDAEVFVDGEKVTVSWDASGKRTEIRVKPGTHQIELKKDGFIAEGERVSLAEGGHEIVSAMMVRPVSARPLDEPGRKERGMLNPGKPGIAELDSLQADLTNLVYARHPNRLKTRNHALEELDAARKAMAAGKAKTEVQEHLDKIQTDIESLTGMAENPENRINLLEAEKQLIGAIKAINAAHQESPVSAGGLRDRADGFVPLFNGNDLTGWTALNGAPAKWTVKDGYIEVLPRAGGDIMTKQKFGPDFKLHVEFWLPLMADKQDQARANSGVFLQGRYEIQILDSYKNPTHTCGECGAMYNLIGTIKNASKPPEQWQRYDITFHAPRVDGTGKVIEKGRITEVFNGETVIDDASFDQVTGGALDKNIGEPGPIRLQDHGCKVRFRKIEIKELPSSPAPDPLPKGSVWKGKRTYRKGAYAPPRRSPTNYMCAIGRGPSLRDTFSTTALAAIAPRSKGRSKEKPSPGGSGRHIIPSVS
ncbi:MAG: protein kinase domain-containing protein [Gemmataceae bacterium]